MKPHIRSKAAKQRAGSCDHPILKHLAIKIVESNAEERCKNHIHGDQSQAFISKNSICYSAECDEHRKSWWMGTLLPNIKLMQSASEKNVVPFKQGSRNGPQA